MLSFTFQNQRPNIVRPHLWYNYKNKFVENTDVTAHLKLYLKTLSTTILISIQVLVSNKSSLF